MIGRIICVRELGPRDEAAWRSLTERAAEPNPLFEPDCVVPAAVHQKFGDEIELAVAEEDGTFYAAMPIRRMRRWKGIPYSWVFTKVRRMMYCGTPLVDPERAAEAMAAIFSVLRQRGVWRGRVLVLEEVAEDGPAHSAVLEAARGAGRAVYRYSSWERPFLRRRPEATYNSLHAKKHMAKLAMQRRKLDATVGKKVQLLDRSGDPAAVEEIIRLEAAGYKGTTGVAMTSVPGEPEYFRSMCDGFRALGRLHIYTLEAGETVCAIMMFLQGEDGLFTIKVGYDTRFSRWSPGLQLHFDFIQHFHDKMAAQWIDVCTYEGNQTLLRVYPDRRRFTSLLIPLSKNPLDRLVSWALVVARPMGRRLAHRSQAPKPRSSASSGTSREKVSNLGSR